ncbi:orotate phosphoribosyltransferase [Paenibacillus oenotherae]|uniref:Orotate phosphoribosyltransferase n=1 Tax=Paenibacillus oenotherae TaxID=1435645 RepID=A0ABS7DC26_9BACL|nr:orotate phosphoribosyltransferase [Paenibacillus oenotherae]MBW7476708.1 orotate phosphoribosyltransferase [Paenibacillus oenotherae]
MNRISLTMARDIYKAAHIGGTSGASAKEAAGGHFDKYLLMANPRLLGSISAELATRIPVGSEVLAGIELGGIPIVTVLSMETNIPAAFIRKKASGINKLTEGTAIHGKRVCVVHDVVVTGSHIVRSVNDLREAGAVVNDVICIIESNPEARANLQAAGLRFHALFTLEQLVLAGESE